MFACKTPEYLSSFFNSIAIFISEHPKPAVISPLLFTFLFSFGFLAFDQVSNIRYEYTDKFSPSHYEFAVAQDFFEQKGKLFTMKILIMANGNHSLLSDELAKESKELINHLETEITVKDGSKNYTFSQLCQPFCILNDPVKYVLLFRNFKLKYPVADLFGRSLYIGNDVYMIELKGNILKSVKLFQLQFASIANDTTWKLLEKWETKATEFMQEYRDNRITVYCSGVGYLTKEITRNAIASIPYLSVAFAAVLGFVVVSSSRKMKLLLEGPICLPYLIYLRGYKSMYLLAITGFLRAGLDSYVLPVDPFRNLAGQLNKAQSKHFTVLAGCLASMMGSLSAFGLLLGCGIKLQPILTVTVYLLISIGVDDIFLMLHAWRLTDDDLALGQKLSLTLINSGPSISITSLTNALAFGVGIFSGIPAVKTICLYTCVSIAFCYFYQLCFFSGILILTHRKDTSGCMEVSGLVLGWLYGDMWNDIKKSWICLISNKISRILLVVLFLLYWAISIYGLINLKVDISIDKLVLDDSSVIQFEKVMQKHIYSGVRPVTIFVNSCPDLTKAYSMEQIRSVMFDYENATHSVGKDSTQIWLLPYMKFLENNGLQNFTYKNLFSFLKIHPVWSSTMKLERNQCLSDSGDCIKSFFFMTGYRGVIDFQTRYRALREWREIAKSYQTINVTVFQELSHFTDQIYSIPQTTVTTVIAALCCMFFVCAVFIQNIALICMAVLSVLSINLGVIGLLSLWQMELDPLTMASLLAAVGFSVDFTAHSCFHLFKAKDMPNMEKRLEALYSSVAWPSLQAAISTLLPSFVVFFYQSYIVLAFMKTVILVVTLGLVHGFIFIPVAYVSISQCVLKKSQIVVITPK